MKYCKNCGGQLNDNQAICLNCGVNVGQGNSFCSNCGKSVNPEASVCLNCGVAIKPTSNSTNSGIFSTVKEIDKSKAYSQLANKEKNAFIVWLIIGILQCLTFAGLICGIWNIYNALQRKSFQKTYCIRFRQEYMQHMKEKQRCY